MNSMKLWTTTPSAAVAGQSCFGMPMRGHAFGATTPATALCTATALVVRERAGIAATPGAVKRDLGVAQSDFPGTTAWRPPTC